MILGISIGRGFDNYSELYDTVQAIKPKEICSYSLDIVRRYAKETYTPLQEFEIDWQDLRNATNVKKNKWGKLYDKDAPMKAATKIVEYCDKIVEFSGGDYHIRQIGKNKIISEEKTRAGVEKRYQL